LISAASCDKQLSEDRKSQLTADATSWWIDGTGLRVARKEGLKHGDNSVEVIFLELNGARGDRAQLCSLIADNMRSSARHSSVSVKQTEDLFPGRNYDSRATPPDWFLPRSASGRIISVVEGPRIYVPDSGDPVFVIYVCP